MKINEPFEILRQECPTDEKEIEKRFQLLITFLLENSIISEHEFLSYVEEI